MLKRIDATLCKVLTCSNLYWNLKEQVFIISLSASEVSIRYGIGVCFYHLNSIVNAPVRLRTHSTGNNLVMVCERVADKCPRIIPNRPCKYLNSNELGILKPKTEQPVLSRSKFIKQVKGSPSRNLLVTAMAWK